MPPLDPDAGIFKTPLTWIVVARQAPLYLRENPSERAWTTFVLERETDLVLGQDMTLTASLDPVIGLVREALAKPLAGPKRRPARLLVEEQALAPLLSDAFGIPVEVAPRPIAEADAFIEVLRQFLVTGGSEEMSGDDGGREERSYFDSGLPASQVRDLIRTGAALAKVRPWDLFPNEALIRLDIPDLGVSEACICIIGHMGQSRSVLVFRSHDDYLVHLGMGERLAQRSEFSVDPIDLGIPILALDFEEAADCPARMRAEAEAMGLKPGRKALYPNIFCMDKDGVHRPVAEPDVRLIVALATALERTFRRSGRRIGNPDSWPICEETLVPGIGVTRLTVPFEAGVLFAGIEGESSVEEPRKDGDDPLIEGMGLLVALAEVRFPDAAREIDRAMKKLVVDTLVPPWVLFHRHPRGTDFTVAETLLANKLGSPEAVDWIKAQTQSWISAWHIAIGADDRFSCRDLITGEFRVDVRADPRTRGRLAKGDVFLGRIVDFEHGPEIFGVALHTLPLRAAGAVVERVGRALKAKQVTPAMLRTHRGGFVVQREWNALVKTQRSR